MYHRIRHQLNAYQSEDQFGFRPGRSTSHALLILERMLSKGVEYNVPMWVVSIDLKKAFDRIDHTALFHALRQQMDLEYVVSLENYTRLNMVMLVLIAFQFHVAFDRVMY